MGKKAKIKEVYMPHEVFFNLLRHEHQKVMDTIMQLEQTQGSKTMLWTQLKQDLIPHMKGEEKYFYPILLSEDKTKENAAEAMQEHKEAESLLNQLDRMMTTSSGNRENLMSTFTSFRDAIQHHIKDEESKVFDDARQYIDENKMTDIMMNFQKEKQQILSSMSG